LAIGLVIDLANKLGSNHTMTEERRRYFRIDDSMGISYRVLGKEEARAFAKQSREHGGNVDMAANFDNRIQTLLDSCRIQAPLTAELIDLMNKKLNFVIQQMDIDAELIHRIAYNQRMVNVSACGIAFHNDQDLSKGDCLQLDMQLYPSGLQVVLLASVVESTALAADEVINDLAWFVRLDFTEVNANDEELLIQHVVKQQSAILKKQRNYNL
jgi:hypothetical protein